MSDDRRPYPATDWETTQREDAEDAVRKAEEAAAAAEIAVEHSDSTMSDLIEYSKEIAANSKAVETLTREALIADNKKFRRRNGVLVFLTSVLILGMGYMIYRDIYINSPGRVKITEQTAHLQDANDKLDDIEAFIDRVELSQGDSITEEDLQPVFDAVFETRILIQCVLAAPDVDAARNCVTAVP